jgi:predicted oxidoreductase
MSLANLSSSQLRQAADLKDKIAELEKELAAVLGGETKAAPITAKPAKKRFVMSAAAKARISAAAKASVVSLK